MQRTHIGMYTNVFIFHVMIKEPATFDVLYTCTRHSLWLCFYILMNKFHVALSACNSFIPLYVIQFCCKVSLPNQFIGMDFNPLLRMLPHIISFTEMLFNINMVLYVQICNNGIKRGDNVLSWSSIHVYIHYIYYYYIYSM